MERVSGFDDNQSRAIKCYLEYLKLNHEDEFPDNELQKAIDRYWFIF